MLTSRPLLSAARSEAGPITTHPALTPQGYWLTAQRQPRLVIVSGAGLSQESGLDVFRGTDGLWENHRVEEICDGRVWTQFRDQVNRFYEARRAANQAALPHDGHRWCAEQEERGAVLITQNIDTLLERAGAEYVLHLHGQIDHHECFSCSLVWPWALAPQLQCPVCQSLDTRAFVVFFHEPVPHYPIASRIVGGLKPQDVLLVIGTSGKVLNPVRWLAERAQVWVVDPEPAEAWATLAARARFFKTPASQLRETVGVAWQAYLQEVARA